MQRKLIAALILVLACALPAVAGDKQKGSTALKDFGPAGTPGKNQKHQQFDFTFVVSGTQLTCRSSEGTKLKATEFPVGSDISYEVDKDKAKVKNKSGKEVKCTVVRVEQVSDTSTPAVPK